MSKNPFFFRRFDRWCIRRHTHKYSQFFCLFVKWMRKKTPRRMYVRRDIIKFAYHSFISTFNSFLSLGFVRCAVLFYLALQLKLRCWFSIIDMYLCETPLYCKVEVKLFGRVNWMPEHQSTKLLHWPKKNSVVPLSGCF